MQIWHDDLGIESDPHEMRVQPEDCVAPWVRNGMPWRVSGADAAIASRGESEYGFMNLCNWFRTIELVMLAGF